MPLDLVSRWICRGPAVLLLASLCLPLPAQWNPPAGSWNKSSPSDLRVMTWNVKDGICSSNPKVAGTGNWSALVRIVAALRPDVLILQEAGDNDGNGTGSGVDSVAALTTTLDLFQAGGLDPFRPGSPPVTAFVQLYAPAYSLPYTFVSSVSDGFNRDVILSRYPLVDLNGDTRSTLSDLPTINGELYAPGGNGGIRGYQVAEIDLPDVIYAGDLVVGNSHLKAGSSSSNHAQRVEAAQNIAYFLDYFYNGAGLGVPDPHGRIADNPPALAILGPNTALVTGGDWNEDEQQNGSTRGPAAWITQALIPDAALGTDGPDRDRTDMTFDAATDVFTGDPATISGAKFDYLAWQDGVITLRRAFVFNTATVNPAGAMPPEIIGYSSNPGAASAAASDHRPVVMDLILPAALGCNSAAVDWGFAKVGSNGRFPRFSACGALASGQAATLSLWDTDPFALVLAGYSASFGLLNVAGGTIVPLSPILVGPFQTDASGTLSFPLGGGGGPLEVFMQWGVLDSGATFGLSLSNALELRFLP